MSYRFSAKSGRRNTHIRGEDILQGHNILLEKNAGGIRISGNPPVRGTVYTGFCKVSQVSGEEGVNTVLIHNGTPLLTPEERENNFAGYAVINDYTIQLPAARLTLSGTQGFISVSFSLGGTVRPSFDGYSCTGYFPEAEVEKISFVIATYGIKSSGRPVINQQHTGVFYGWIFRNCGEI